MIRLHFTIADLGKITFSPAPNALGEATASVHRLHRWRTGLARPRPGTRRWHREVSSSLEARAGRLFDLIPRRPAGWMPCFLLQPTINDLPEALDLISQAAEPELAANLRHLDPHQRAGRWTRELASGTAGTQRLLVNDLRNYFDSSIAGLWPQIQAAAVTDRALRSETLLRGGVDALFATLGTGWRWQPPTLHIPAPFTVDIHLEGGGLLLAPSYFTIAPVVWHLPSQNTVLVYPMYLGDRPDGSIDALAPLLGHTRAAVLAALRVPATTTSLADRASISLSSASQHTTALRNAGLISTTRQGIAVQHALTPIGAALLQSDSVCG